MNPVSRLPNAEYAGVHKAASGKGSSKMAIISRRTMIMDILSGAAVAAAGVAAIGWAATPEAVHATPLGISRESRVQMNDMVQKAQVVVVAPGRRRRRWHRHRHRRQR
jgi:hypothetical protein